MRSLSDRILTYEVEKLNSNIRDTGGIHDLIKGMLCRQTCVT